MRAVAKYGVSLLALFFICALPSYAQALNIRLIKTHQSSLNFTTGELYINNIFVAHTLEPGKGHGLASGNFSGVIEKNQNNVWGLNYNNKTPIYFGDCATVNQRCIQTGLAIDNTPKSKHVNGKTVLLNIKDELKSYIKIESIFSSLYGLGANNIEANIHIEALPNWQLSFIRNIPEIPGYLVASRDYMQQLAGSAWRSQHRMIVDGQEKLGYPDQFYDESYRNDAFIVLNIKNPSDGTKYRIPLQGGCAQFYSGGKWLLRPDSQPYIRVYPASDVQQAHATCIIGDDNWYEDIAARIFDPFAIGKYHAASSSSNNQRILGTFEVGSRYPNLGMVYVVLPAAKIQAIESSQNRSIVYHQRSLDAKSRAFWQAYFRKRAKIEDIPIWFSASGLFSTGVDVTELILSYLFSETKSKINAGVLSYLMAEGGEFLQYISIKRDGDKHPYLHNDLYYQIKIGNETRLYPVYSSRYAVKQK